MQGKEVTGKKGMGIFQCSEDEPAHGTDGRKAQGLTVESWRPVVESMKFGVAAKHATADASSASHQRPQTRIGGVQRRVDQPTADAKYLHCATACCRSNGKLVRMQDQATAKGSHDASDALTGSMLPVRETLVRPSLPLARQESVALQMKSSIESLYHDTVATISSSEMCHIDGGENNCGSSSPSGELLSKSGTGAGGGFVCTAHAATSTSCSTEKSKTCLSLPKESCGRGAEEGHFFTIPSAHGDIEGKWKQVHRIIEDCRRELGGTVRGERLVKKRPLDETNSAALKGNEQSRGVVFVVRENWEALTLYYCSNSGEVRAVASELSRVSTLSSPPDLCKELPTMTVGGSGCKQCQARLGRACNGWWRSRYVLSRVTVTLASQPSTAFKQQEHAAFGGYGRYVAAVNDWSGDWSESKKTNMERRRGMQSPLSSEPPQAASNGMEACEYSDQASLQKGAEVFAAPTEVLWDHKTAVHAPNQLVNPPEKCPPNGAHRDMSTYKLKESSDLEVKEVGTLKPKDVSGPKETSVSSNCTGGTPLETTEFGRDPLAFSGGAKDPSLRTEDNAFVGEQESGYAMKEGSLSPEVVLSDFFSDELSIGVRARKAPETTENSSGDVRKPLRLQEPSTCDFKDEYGNDTWAINDRRSRLASLLSAPCDSFEGFQSGEWRDEPTSEKSSLDEPSSNPFAFLDSRKSKPQEMPHEGSSFRVARQRQRYGTGEPICKSRGHRYAGPCGGRRKKARRPSKSQASARDSAEGAWKTLAQCYAACAQTIGLKTVAEAQSSSLGMCGEERELAGEFLDFVSHVAPGVLKALGDTHITRLRQRKSLAMDYMGDDQLPLLTHQQSKRKQMKLTPQAVSGTKRHRQC